MAEPRAADAGAADEGGRRSVHVTEHVVRDEVEAFVELLRVERQERQRHRVDRQVLQ